MAYLRERGIGCAVHYPIPLPRQPLYAGAATCPVAEALAASVLSIPVHPNVTDEERAYVARTISMDAGVIGTGTMGRRGPGWMNGSRTIAFARLPGLTPPLTQYKNNCMILQQRVYTVSPPTISPSSWILTRSAKEIEYLLLGDLFISRYLGDDNVKRPHRERPVKRYSDG